MGLFDWYSPAGELPCPVDGHPLRTWQGKDGPCAQFHWREGEKHPVASDFDVDAGEGIPREDWHEFRLSETFIIYSYDCPAHQPVEAECSTRDGVWHQTVVLDNAAWRAWEERLKGVHRRRHLPRGPNA